MPETDAQVAVRLKYRACRPADIADADRTPEALVRATIADMGPVFDSALRALPWWSSRRSRFECALLRLFFAGEIRQVEQGWECVEVEQELSAWSSRERRDAKPAASKGIVQKTLW